MFKTNKSYKEFLKEEGEKIPYATMNENELDIKSIPDKSITLEQWKTIRGNTYGFEALYSKVNDETLEYITNHFINNCSIPDRYTYNYGLQKILIPELLKRLRNK